MVFRPHLFTLVLALSGCKGTGDNKVTRGDESVLAPAVTRADESVLAPVIGTRAEQDGQLTPTYEIDDSASGLYIGCDLPVSDIPQGTEIELVWIFKPEVLTDLPRVVGTAWYNRDKSRGEPLRAAVDQVWDKNARKLGSYECVWTVDRRGASARIRVRDSQKPP